MINKIPLFFFFAFVACAAPRRPTDQGNSPLTSSVTLRDLLRKKYYVPEVFKSDITIGSVVDADKDYATVMSPGFCFGKNKLPGSYSGKADLPDLERITTSKFSLSVDANNILPGLAASTEMRKQLSMRIEHLYYSGFAYGEANITSACQTAFYTRYRDQIHDGRFSNPKLVGQAIYADGIILEIDESSKNLLSAKTVIAKILSTDPDVQVEEINAEKLRIKNKRVLALTLVDFKTTNLPAMNLPKSELGRGLYEIVPVSANSSRNTKTAVGVSGAASIPE